MRLKGLTYMNNKLKRKKVNLLCKHKKKITSASQKCFAESSPLWFVQRTLGNWIRYNIKLFKKDLNCHQCWLV